MKKARLFIPLLFIFFAGLAGAQSGSVIPQGGAGHANQAGCIVVKRMGPADQVTSHLYSFGIRGKQFQYVEGKYPEGFPFHGRMTDHDIRNLQGRGAEVLILEPSYTTDDLKRAREECRKMTDKTTNQVSDKGTIEITSTPSGADIELDGQFVGNTPSPLSVTPGEHGVKLVKTGYTSWERRINLSAGSSLKIAPDLERTTPGVSTK
ncbi:MAG: hypothetical protein CXZ00_02895 [Acidobacteria bacterium]|nr:MAG: hypothetical protein CXZ00_02895 [Acidobacteriota bacterium]